MNCDLQLQDIVDLGFDVQEIYPRVFKIRNFASTEEVNGLLRTIQTINEDAWSYSYMQHLRDNCLAKFGRDDLDNLVAEGLLEITSSWADKNYTLPHGPLAAALLERSNKVFQTAGDFEGTGFVTIQRMYEGSELKAHHDQYSDKFIEYAAVLYLNDDYRGGELFFSNFEGTVRPEPGSLMVFPGTALYEHGVHFVEEGPVRYVLPTFVKASRPEGFMAGWGDFG